MPRRKRGKGKGQPPTRRTQQDPNEESSEESQRIARDQPPTRPPQQDPNEEPSEESQRIARDVAEIEQMRAESARHYASLRESLAGATLGGHEMPDLLDHLENFSNMLLDTGMHFAQRGLYSRREPSSGQQPPVDPATIEAMVNVDRMGSVICGGIGVLVTTLAQSCRTEQAQGGAAASGSAAAFRALLESSAAPSSSAASLGALFELGAPASLGALLESGTAASPSAGGSERTAEEPMERSPHQSEESSGEDEGSSAVKKP